MMLEYNPSIYCRVWDSTGWFSLIGRLVNMKNRAKLQDWWLNPPPTRLPPLRFTSGIDTCLYEGREWERVTGRSYPYVGPYATNGLRPFFSQAHAPAAQITRNFVLISNKRITMIYLLFIYHDDIFIIYNVTRYLETRENSVSCLLKKYWST